MFFTDATFIGIDPTAGEKPFTYAAINNDLSLLALGEGTIDDVLAFCAGQSQALVAICGPRRPNQGVMRRGDVRENLTPVPVPGRWTNFRMAEFLIRQHNIHIPQTRSKSSDCPNWMRMCFNLFERLEILGYLPYPKDNSDRQYIEVYPHACYTTLLGVQPFNKHTLEGRIQRQLALYEERMEVPDPMRIFEEFTRYRLLNGIIALDQLYSSCEMDALVASYTAALAVTDPGKVTMIGDPDEGQIVLPTDKLKEKYSHSKETHNT